MKKPRIWLMAIAAFVCMGFFAACAKEGANKKTPDLSDLYGTYVFEETVYMNKASSFLPMKGSMPTYTLTEDSLIITELGGSERITAVVYEQADVNEEAFYSEFWESGFEAFDAGRYGVPDISAFKTRRQYTLSSASDSAPQYRLYLMDDEVWFANLIGYEDSMMSIYKLSKTGGST